MKNITVIGAGLVGSLLSIYLAKRGHKVQIFERRPDMRKEKIIAGRSINLALSDRGWKGLEGVGIADEIRKIAIPMHGRIIHDTQGKTNFQPYGKEGQAIYSVSRGDLNKRLMDLAEAQNGTQIFFNQRCVDVDLEKATAIFADENGTTTKNTSDMIFGTDGAYSELRHRMMFTDRFDYSQDYLKEGYKELNIPPAEGGGWRMEKNALHIWPRGKFMLIALPNFDGSFTCTLFFPFEGEYSFSSLDTKEKMLEFFNKTFPDAVELMPTLEHDYFNNPTSSLAIMRCFPWSYKDKALLLGDAAHAIVPFYGQGMNCGFEDCTVLEQIMQEENDWQRIFKKFETARKPNSDAIAELALHNFIEMRDLVADEKFVLRKKIEAKLSAEFPDKWLPLYSMVTFSDIPYSVAWNEEKRQDALMQQVMQIPGIENSWNTEEGFKQITKTVLG
ncbi:MAG: FAD-dependent oxidoreductase [Bacteroidia bacterium]